MASITRFEDIKLTDIVIERFQVRKQNTSKDIAELAQSIKRFGLLQPVVVVRSEKFPKKWELIAGQRRLLAHRELGLSTIPAGIVEGPISLEEGLALSATENILRLDMSRKDLVDLCGALFQRYGTIKDVAEETKLPYHVVRQYIKYDALPEKLQDLVRKKEINLDVATKVQDAASATGTFDQDEADRLIKVISKTDDEMGRRILELRKKNPDVSTTKIVEEAKKPVKKTSVKLVFMDAEHDAINRYAEDNDGDVNSVAHDLVLEALGSKGYMEDT